MARLDPSLAHLPAEPTAKRVGGSRDHQALPSEAVHGAFVAPFEQDPGLGVVVEGAGDVHPDMGHTGLAHTPTLEQAFDFWDWHCQPADNSAAKR